MALASAKGAPRLEKKARPHPFGAEKVVQKQVLWNSWFVSRSTLKMGGSPRKGLSQQAPIWGGFWDWRLAFQESYSPGPKPTLERLAKAAGRL